MPQRIVYNYRGGYKQMILDSIKHSEQYAGMHPAIDKGLEFLRSADAGALQDGRHEIDGDRVYALVQSYETGEASTRRFEGHHRYVDIQYIASGRELIYWQQTELLPADGEYDGGTDAVFFRDAESIPLHLRAGDFAVLFPQDAHKPGCSVTGSESVRKIVVKCRLD